MTNIVPMPGVIAPDEINVELLQFLERLIEDVKSGDVKAFIGVGLRMDGSLLEVWSEGNEVPTRIVGALELLKCSYIKNS